MSIGLDDLLIGGDALGDLGVLHDSVLGLGDLDLGLVERLSLDFPLSLQSGNNVLVLPADLVSESSQRAVSPAGLQPEDLEGRGDDHLLLFVIRRGDSLECLQALQGVLSSLGLVRSHATDSSPEDLGRSSEVESATAGLDVAPLPQEVEVLQLVTVEVSGDVDLLTPHDDDLLPVEDELGDDGGQTPEHVGAAVNDNGLGCEARHSSEK